MKHSDTSLLVHGGVSPNQEYDEGVRAMERRQRLRRTQAMRNMHRAEIERRHPGTTHSVIPVPGPSNWAQMLASVQAEIAARNIQSPARVTERRQQFAMPANINSTLVLSNNAEDTITTDPIDFTRPIMDFHGESTRGRYHQSKNTIDNLILTGISPYSRKKIERVTWHMPVRKGNQSKKNTNKNNKNNTSNKNNANSSNNKNKNNNKSRKRRKLTHSFSTIE